MADTDFDMNPRVVCVLGMHRSGTSLVSKIVNLLGYQLGPEEHLMVPNESNPKGFWEHQLLTNLNDAILARFGGTWDKPPNFPDRWEALSELDDLREHARAIIAADFSNVATWGWKDPRTCLTLPFWQRLMPPMRYVITLRNPLDVAQSLAKRDDFPLQKGNDLWLAHVTGALTHTAGWPRALFFYDDFVNDWESELERLSNFIGTNDKHLQEDCRIQVRSFLDEELRHHRTPLPDTVQVPHLSFETKSFYFALRLSVSDHRESDGSVAKELDDLLEHLGRYAATAKTSNSGEDAKLAEQLTKVKMSLAFKDSEAMAQKRVIDELNITTSRYEKLLSEKESELALLRVDHERLEQQTLKLEGTSRAQGQRLAAIETSLAWLLILKYRNFRDVILPPQTRRRRMYDSMRNLSKGTLFNADDLRQTQTVGFNAIRRLWDQVGYNSTSLRTLMPVTQSTSAFASEAIRWIPIIQIAGEAKSALFFHPPAKISYKLIVPPNGNFVAGVALVPEAWGQNHGGVEFEVCVSSGETGELKGRTLIDPTRRKGHRRWVPFKLSLRKFSNQEVAVTLATSVPADGSNAFAWAVWGDPAVVSRKPIAELHKLARQQIQNYGFAGAFNKVRAKFKQLRAGVPAARQPHPFWYSGPHRALGRQSQRDVMSFSRLKGVQDEATSVYASVLEMVPQDTIDIKLSVVIPTKDALFEEFESTLQAIRRQKGIREIETIVVDSGSKDKTVALAKEYGANVYCIPPEQFNHGLTRNYGAEQTSGDLIIFMVQDAIPATDDLFFKMVQGLRSDDRFAGVSVRQVPRSNADIIACWERWNHNNFCMYGSLHELPSVSGKDVNTLTLEQLRLLTGLDNSCSVVRREVWEKIKFDSVDYAEDIQFGLRCLNYGYRIGWLPHCSVIHSHTRSVLEYLTRYYLDKRVLLGMFDRDDGVRNFGSMTPDHVVLAVKANYLAVAEFLNSVKSVASQSPSQRLDRLQSYAKTRCRLEFRDTSTPGEPSLDKFFANFEPRQINVLPSSNPCVENFESVLDSIIQFVRECYPYLTEAAFSVIAYKAFAIAAGSVLGEYYFVCHRDGKASSGLERLHAKVSTAVGDS
jgi:glycosyltransferase involved in cell wall biosynthesis